MEVHTAGAAAKRMWSYLRAVFFMARKGVLSNKRKLLVSMHLRNKAVARTVANLLSHHHHHPGHNYGGNALRRRDYEFSCTNSPALPFAFSTSRRRHANSFFPCLGAVALPEDDHFPAASEPAPPLARIEYSYSPAPSSPAGLLLSAPGEEDDFSVRVSNYSSEDEGAGGGSDAVDDAAEDFIRRFYDQLRRQNHVALLPAYMQECAAA